MTAAQRPNATGIQSSDRVFLLRHGIVRSPGEAKRYIGQQDLPLLNRGLQQAMAWADYFATAALDVIYCSDLARCLETARIIGDRCHLVPRVRPELREVALGDWEGQPFASIKRCDPDGYQRRGAQITDHRPPGGESFRDLDHRVWPFFETASRQPHRRVLMITHAGVIRVLICRLLGMPLDKLFHIGQAYGALNIVDVRRSGYRLQALNLPSPA
jgi:probable phosphoglycerate mutase